MSLIYKLTSKTSKKSYIGLTIGTVEARFNSHIKDSKNGSNYAIHRAIRKHGVEDFEVEVLEENIENENLHDREIYFISKFGTYSRGYNMTKGGEGTLGQVTVVDTFDNKTKNIEMAEYRNNKNRYESIRKNKTCVFDDGGNVVTVSTKEYHENKNNFKHILDGTIAVTDKRDNSSKRVSVEDYKNNDFYVFASEGKVNVIDIRDGTSKTISTEEFHKYDFYVHHTKGTTTVIDIRNGKIKKVSVEDYRSKDYYRHVSSKRIEIYDNEDNLRFSCFGNFNKTCKENGLSISLLAKSYKNNGEPILSNCSKNSKNKILRDGNGFMKGWYALKY